MKPVLVLFTLEYPDPLLDKELNILSKEFEAVYVLPGKTGELSALPANVQIFSLFKPVEQRKIGRLVFRHFFLISRAYFWALFESGEQVYYLKYIKSFLGHLVVEAEKIAPLKSFIIERQLQNAVFYDYWLVDATLTLAELRRKKFIQIAIARAHGFDLYHERQFEQRVPFQAYRIKHLDSVFTISEHGFNYLLRHIPRRLSHKVKLSYLGITNPYMGLLPQKSFNGFMIVSCSDMIPLKRIDLFIETLRLIQLNIRWIHFGDGPLRNPLTEMLKTLPGNIQVDFRGKTKNEEILAFYTRNFVDLFISLSESEGLPVSMMEAISFGIPILACNVNGVPEIVTPETGILVDKEDQPASICTALEETLLHTHFDRESIRRFCQQKFNAERNFALFAKQIKQLAGYDG